MFLDVSQFQKDENIFYYFEFDRNDALYVKNYNYGNNNKNKEYGTLIDFYEGEIDEIVQNNNTYSVYFGTSYSKKPKTYKSSTSKTKFYFSSKKKDSKYLIIALNTNSYIEKKYTFKNTEKDESKLSTTTIIIIVVVIVVIVAIGIIGGICYAKRAKKKKNTQTDDVQGGYDQQGQYIHQTQNSQNVQIYTQQPQYDQQGQYVQQPQNNQQGQYVPMSNDVGYSSQGVA